MESGSTTKQYLSCEKSRFPLSFFKGQTTLEQITPEEREKEERNTNFERLLERVCRVSHDYLFACFSSLCLRGDVEEEKGRSMKGAH